jgi:RND family efflux transporter MFP subunit
MKRICWLSACFVLLAACASPTPAAPLPTAAPVQITHVQSPDVVVASAKVQPAQAADLGFTVSALVKEISVKEGDLVQAGEILMTLNMPDLEYAVIAAEEEYKARDLAAELQKADRVKYVNPDTGNIRWLPLPREVYLKARARADQSLAALESARAILAQTALAAPFDAMVVSIHVIPGEWVQVDQVVITLAALEKMQVTTTDLSERDIARVKPGQDAQVYIEALDLTVPGKVVRISPAAEILGGDVVYPVTIELEEQPAGLLWGMSAEVTIRTK